MTEKRYKHMCNDFGKFTIHSIFDTQTNECYGDDNYPKIVDLLNNQDRRIKRLEKELEKEQLDDITMRERYRDNLLMDPTKCIHLKPFDKVIGKDGREHLLYKCEKGHSICQESMFDPICEDYEIIIKSIQK